MPVFLCHRFDAFPTSGDLRGYVVRYFSSDDAFPGSFPTVKRVSALLWPWISKKIAEFRAHLCKIVVLTYGGAFIMTDSRRSFFTC